MTEFNTNIEYWKNRYNQMDPTQVVGHRKWSTDEYSEENKKWENIIKSVIDKDIPDNRKQNVLDFGCGICRWYHLLNKHFNNYFGCDIVKDVVESNKSNIPDIGMESILDSRIPFGDIEFDMIFSCVVMQHVIDNGLLSHYIEQFTTRLRDGGYLMLIENTSDNKDSNYIKFRKKIDYISECVKLRLKFVKEESFFSTNNEEHSLLLFKK